jgi:hypothetical protein
VFVFLAYGSSCSLLGIPITLALYVLLRRSNQSIMTLAAALGFLFASLPKR